MQPAADALRDAVIGGRFVGIASASEGLAALTASSDAMAHLRLWFGERWLAALAMQPDRSSFLRAALDRDIAAIDALCSAQLDAVLHHPRLLRLEGSWRGLAWLVARLPQQGRTRLRLMHARWAEICRDIERATDFDQSNLFRKIYEEQFGMAGGEPFGLIIADYEVRHLPAADHPTNDVNALMGLASIAAAAFAPVILGASPQLLGLNSFSEAAPGANLGTVFKGSDYQRWRNAASREDMRFIAVALPRVLGRAPWVDDGGRVDRFRYRTLTPGSAQRVWSSAVYSFAAVAIRAFNRYSWPADLRGADISDEARGGVVDGLPAERFASDPSRGAPTRAPMELALTDDQENQINELGVIPLTSLDGLAEGCFAALPSLHKPPRQTAAQADANQRLSSQVNTMLCASRFAHCVKLMGRDMIGSYLAPDEVEFRLQRWLNGFVSGIGSNGAETAAKYPLLDARVEVREQRGRPGIYGCTIHLKPHHQLDEIGAAFKLVTDFATRSAAAA
jgi:type VI secretion system ImpC/EvpB family protein